MVSRWIDQLITFIEEVIIPEHQISGKAPVKVHLIGNSVGGHLAAHLANRRPDLVGSLCLLNPTPVWGLNLPGWSGHLPAPAIPKRIGRYLFDQIRDLRTIEKYLENAYARKDAFTEELVSYLCTVEVGNALTDYKFFVSHKLQKLAIYDRCIKFVAVLLGMVAMPLSHQFFGVPRFRSHR